MKKIIVLGILIIALGVYLYQQKDTDVLVVDLPLAQEYQDFALQQAQDLATSTLDIEEEIKVIKQEETLEEEALRQAQDDTIEEDVLIDAINLNVPFTSQAPTANWEQPWQDACEEASILMVDYYYRNSLMPESAEVESVLAEMVDWQIENWGDHRNLTMEELSQFITTTFGYQTELIFDLTPEKIKEYLVLGQPVIIPADGKKLANPYFSNGGPEYHMLVVKGYSDNNFITNDPGTSRGEDFIYTSENLFASIFDWNQKESQATGPKIGLVIIR